MDVKYGTEKAVRSEGLRRRAFPVARVEMMGLKRLWNCGGPVVSGCAGVAVRMFKR